MRIREGDPGPYHLGIQNYRPVLPCENKVRYSGADGRFEVRLHPHFPPGLPQSFASICYYCVVSCDSLVVGAMASLEDVAETFRRVAARSALFFYVSSAFSSRKVCERVCADLQQVYIFLASQKRSTFADPVAGTWRVGHTPQCMTICIAVITILPESLVLFRIHDCGVPVLTQKLCLFYVGPCKSHL